MGQQREVSKMLTVSDGYWYMFHKKRLYRFFYATFTFFASFALVVAFFKVGQGTQFAPDYVKEKINYTGAELEENEQLLQWIYIFYPSPLVCAWFVVYFGKFFFCWKIKRLRKARNYKYNLLLAVIVMSFLYAGLFKGVLKMDVIDGPKFRVAMILLFCEVCLVGIEVFDMHKMRKARHERKRLLRKQLETEAEIQRRVAAGESMEEGPPQREQPTFPFPRWHRQHPEHQSQGVLV